MKKKAEREREREREMSVRKCRGQCHIGLHDPVQPWKGTKEYPIPTTTKNEWENRSAWGKTQSDAASTQ